MSSAAQCAELRAADGGTGTEPSRLPSALRRRLRSQSQRRSVGDDQLLPDGPVQLDRRLLRRLRILLPCCVAAALRVPLQQLHAGRALFRLLLGRNVQQYQRVAGGGNGALRRLLPPERPARHAGEVPGGLRRRPGGRQLFGGQRRSAAAQSVHPAARSSAASARFSAGISLRVRDQLRQQRVDHELRLSERRAAAAAATAAAAAAAADAG